MNAYFVFFLCTTHRMPQELSSGLHNCSVADHRRFQEPLLCNLTGECQHAQKEKRDHPSSSATSPACQGWVVSGHKCFKRFRSNRLAPLRARNICRSRGFELASIKTQQESQDAKKVFSWTGNLIGLTYKSESVPSMYRKFLVWSDKTIIYNIKHIFIANTQQQEKASYYFQLEGRGSAVGVHVVSHARSYHGVICEKPAQSIHLFPTHSVEYFPDQLSMLAFQRSNQSLVICPGRHVTHAFLSCDAKRQCGQATCFFLNTTMRLSQVLPAAQRSVNIVAMYTCTGDDTEVPYSLLCDFRQDCADKSDESFCHHPHCKEFSCRNGQCLPRNKSCNKYMDCLDGSDEKVCPHEESTFYISSEYRQGVTDLSKARFFNIKYQNESYLINLDGRGYFTQQEMNLTDPCPVTHYRCTKEWFYCLPIYTRCNGFFDCIFQEDEKNCEGWTCPNLYRCRGSTVCVHVDSMCDGWPQCPQRDDEWLCDMTCPAQCLCQGHSFLCPQPFSANLFLQLRYLDASGSGMTPFDLMNNTYMVHLILARCSVRFVPDMRFANLHVFDLSYNELKSILMNVFIHLRNLKVLILKGNPLTSVTVSPSNMSQNMLRMVDLSKTHLSVFDSKIFSYTPGIQHISVSYSSMYSIRTQFYQTVSYLRELDIRGTMIKDFPLRLFSRLNYLTRVLASDYRLCCEENLPNIAPKPSCLAPRHFLSSCDDMLQSKVYRLNFWFVAVLASLMNMVCCVCHCVKTYIPIPYGGAVVVFMASLQCADFCMGIYTTIISAACETFSGQYLHYEHKWKESVACTVAGFLCLLSSEVSVLTVCLLTLDHFTTVVFQHEIYRFSMKSASVACAVVWLVGILLASLSLLPGLSESGHYGQTAVCNVLVNENLYANQKDRFFHTVVILNFFICFVVCATLVIIYRATPRHQVLIDSTNNRGSTSVDVIMRIAIVKVAGWFSVTITSVLAAAGVTGIDMNVFVSVMVLPLTSALNPLLCLWHAVVFKRRQIQEQRLLRILNSRRKCV